MKLQLIKDDKGVFKAEGIVTIGDAAKIVNKKSPESIKRLVDAGLIRVVMVSNIHCYIKKDLEKVRDNGLTPTKNKK